MKILELFCGTKSFAKVAKDRGHEIFTVDNNPIFNPDICCDILDFDVHKISFNPDIVWASPPCTCFSVASISTHWGGGYRMYLPKTDGARKSLKIVSKTLEIINDTNPSFWFIENPRGVLRKLGVMTALHKKTVTYCQYGDTRMKPTDIWTNLYFWEPRPMCKNGDSCHEAAPRGAKTGTQGLKGDMERSRIPKELCLELIKLCEGRKA
jgi:hypothetical protein